MKKLLIVAGCAFSLLACKTNTETPPAADAAKETAAPAADLPYTAEYSSNWNADVSDADVKTVLMSYKDWETANYEGMKSALADTVEFDRWDGEHMRISNTDLVKMWTTYRDSLSSVKIVMEAWHKMYAPDKKEGYVVAWYREIDTYKDGRVDSADWHDINGLKDGKISWYAQYRRAKK